MTTEHVSRLLACGGSSMSSPTRHFRKPRGAAIRNPYFPSVVIDSGMCKLHIEARALRAPE
jgi:hypothetical protein